MNTSNTQNTLASLLTEEQQMFLIKNIRSLKSWMRIEQMDESRRQRKQAVKDAQMKWILERPELVEAAKTWKLYTARAEALGQTPETYDRQTSGAVWQLSREIAKHSKNFKENWPSVKQVPRHLKTTLLPKLLKNLEVAEATGAAV